MKTVILILFSLFIICACNNNKKFDENKEAAAPILKSQADTANYTEIQWVDSIIDFGTMRTEDSMHFKFRFKNTGSKPLFISEAQSSCGCTVTNYPKDPIMPGKTSFISATFNSNFSIGPVFKTITVMANTKNNNQHVLLLHGEIVSKENR
ncbi:DUF1573 domain-containing protein [Parafilimonas terrae]|uniref:DUF1573 domain-containing protein n=1 Tax=Parafilimonas terrae TaxID=1465490 RepID=A0A1I5Z402_9BACT|nr:DUF1573 domain-containing protein [Parafilimonas terrae]SFQ51216.1 Protein of unknown function [Parafilimonas terrae]